MRFRRFYIFRSIYPSEDISEQDMRKIKKGEVKNNDGQTIRDHHGSTGKDTEVP